MTWTLPPRILCTWSACETRFTPRSTTFPSARSVSEAFPQRKEKELDAIIYLEQTAPGQFVRHSLETVNCDHATCAVGDLDGSGRLDIVTGSLSPMQPAKALTIWVTKSKRG